MIAVYCGAFLLSLILTAFLTPWFRRAAVYSRLVDDPRAAPLRKIHAAPIPLGGGVAIFVAFFGTVLFMHVFALLPPGIIHPRHMLGIFLASSVLMIAGWIDDRWGIPPWVQFSATLLATLVVVASGVGIAELTNPFGGKISLVHSQIALPFGFMLKLPSDGITILWLLIAMYTTKLLDGLDGLVSGIGFIGAVTMFGVSLLPQLRQPQVAVVSAAAAGATVGFLPFNWHPAKIFLGNGGSLFVGFLLGVLAIASGGKLITLLLLLAVPLFDLCWVVFRRVLIEGRSPFSSDRGHFHYRLLDAGLTHRQAVGVLWTASAAAGIAALGLQMQYKVYALGFIILLFAGLAVAVVRVGERRVTLTK